MSVPPVTCVCQRHRRATRPQGQTRKGPTPTGTGYGTWFEPVILNALVSFNGILCHLTRTIFHSVTKCTLFASNLRSAQATSITSAFKGKLSMAFCGNRSHTDSSFIASSLLLHKQLVLPCSSFSSISLTALPSPLFFTSFLSSATTEDGEGSLILLARHHDL
jgi:hypothetical protein